MYDYLTISEEFHSHTSLECLNLRVIERCCKSQIGENECMCKRVGQVEELLQLGKSTEWVTIVMSLTVISNLHQKSDSCAETAGRNVNEVDHKSSVLTGMSFIG